MRLGKYLSERTSDEIEYLEEKLNLTDDEEVIFNELKRGRSIQSISINYGMCVSAINNRIKNIRKKLERVNDYDNL